MRYEPRQRQRKWIWRIVIAAAALLILVSFLLYHFVVEPQEVRGHFQACGWGPDEIREQLEKQQEEIIELARTFTGEAGLIVGHEPVISYAGYILARQEDRGAADRGVPTATALVLSFDGAWEDLAPETCAMRGFYTPPTR